ncbi:MAG: hypothetical protein KAQ69_06840 [Spirochaetales bacterium]|nr:hypothetical protein [Spirochaetales bacterium]
MPSSKFFQSLVYNWPAKILSLVTALLLFFLIQMVSASERSFYIPLEVKIPDNYIVENTAPEQIKLVIKGPEDDIYRIIPEQITSSVDFLDADSDGVHVRKIIIDTELVVGDTEMIIYVLEPDSVKLFLSKTENEDTK